MLGRVLSASRRTELAAHYPDAFAARLEEIGPERVHSVVVWTKDPRNLLTHARLRGALQHVGQVFLQWTITGLGGSFLEPCVPPAEEQVAELPDLVEFVGDARRIHWRYDPLVAVRHAEGMVTNIDLSRFRGLAEPVARAGVPAVHTSFVTLYPKVERRLRRLGAELLPPTPERRAEFLDEMESAAAEFGLKLITCCEPGRPNGRCIDGELLAALHPTAEPCRTERAKGQRELCGCTASFDIGRYLPCPNRCVYCYAHPAT